MNQTAAGYVQGLRLHDNQALLEACDGAEHMYPVFCLDPWFISSGKCVFYLRHWC